MNNINTNIIIRPENSNDYESIRSLNDKAFGRSDESNLIDRIRSTSEYIPDLSLVALLNGKRVLGHIMFTKVLVGTDKRNNALALAPMSVNPKFQKQGIGSMLIQHGIHKAKMLGNDVIIVLGHSEYYPKFGFKRASGWGLICPLEVPDEVFMAMELKEGALQSYKGMVYYSQAFEL